MCEKLYFSSAVYLCMCCALFANHDIRILHLCVMTFRCVNFTYVQVCESYVKLHAWDEALTWQETVESYAAEHSSSPLHKAFITGYDSHYLRLLYYFGLCRYYFST